MSYQTVSGFLAGAVVNGGTVAIGYPAGFSRGDFIPGVDHRLVLNQKELKSPSQIGVSLGSTTATITNNTGATWPAGSPYVFQLEQPGPATGIISMDGKTRMSRVTPWPLQFLDLGSPLASNATGLRAAGPAIGTPPIALALTQNFFDVPRNIVVTSTGNDSGATITVTSKDAYGNPVTETFAGGNIGAANGKKAHFTNITVTLSAAAAANVSVGWGNVLGLPAYVPNAVHLIKELQDDAAAAAGTLVIGDQTSPQSGTTGDVRGTYVPNAAPDGTKAYGLLVAIPDPGYLGAVQYPAV